MRTRFLSIAAFLTAFVALSAAPVSSAEEPDNMAHPGVVALTNEGGEWLYRKFPTSNRLYVSAADSPGKSMCVEGCAFAWPPLLAEDEVIGPVGDWTTFVREDGRRQWAYKGQPVYQRFHDSLENPIGNSIEGWSFLIP